MANKIIKEALKEAGITQWKLADILCIHENTLCRKLRHELPIDEQQRIVGIIKEHTERGE